MSVDRSEIETILPHRYPFLFIDRVIEVEPGKRIVARKLVSNSDPILQGHFPGQPILPGVVQIETMAQAAVILAAKSGAFNPETQLCYLAGVQESKFRAPATPGDALDVIVTAERLGGKIGKFKGEIRCGEALCSSATFIAVIDNQPK